MRFDFKENTFVECDINKNRLAISGSDMDLNWDELSQNVLKLEQIFLQLGIPKGQPVIIYGHKESFYAQAILALIKSDIPYVPIDEIYPIERIKKIKATTDCQVLINCSGRQLEVKFAIEIDKEFGITKNHEAVYSNDIVFNKENPLRYIMFTSGSTGEPKGVQISKNNILSFLDWIEKDYKFKEDEVFLNQSPFTFDVSVYDILSSFMLGASVLLISRKLASKSEVFLEKLKNYKVSVWTSTPSFAYIYLREKNYNISHLNNLRTFIFAGEVLSHRIVKSLHQKFDNPRVINAYGPTEATITTTWIDVTNDIIEKYDQMPIGYPRRDSEILIDNIENEPTKEGEIIIVGDHVSQGYFKNIELTDKKFYRHNGRQAFKTGDLGFYQDGMVFFTGRNDEQIKLHGYRIELGEIDTVISQLDFIEDAITIALKRDEEVKRIITFVIPRIEDETSSIKEKVIKKIENKVPSYMIPGDIVALKSFPVNANHKIDKKEMIRIYSSGEYK
jgi:D-alanine--poly(phosphoribitol) ligase subunit 1